VVPRRLEQLVKLPGVARKTANVVLGTAYRIATGIIVDTHARRVAQRLGLTHNEEPDEVEADLCALFPKRSWVDTGHRLVLHGRYVCQARQPRCEHCPLFELCPTAAAEHKLADGVFGRWTQRADRERQVVASRGNNSLDSLIA
jgi:endonuclease-3